MAVANFQAAFPEGSPSQLRRTVGDLLWGYVELAIGRRASIEGAEMVQTGGICLAGHGGAWDLALISAASKIPITIFVKPPSNPIAAWWITRARTRAGLELLPPTGSALAAYRALKRGRLVVFVQDQRHNQGIPVEFFGRPAWTSRGFGVLASRTGAPLFGAWQWRDADGHHMQIEALKTDVPEDQESAIEYLTQKSQRFYEEKIRHRPHSWLWLHNRWRSLGEVHEQPG
jgi:KDO2-lipid IV(A) lauroyltransferase